ncbi:hypothetical protein ACFP1I_15715 [Dyadobacter subterraneus]|uniref:FecR protein domain-containing protein n=1 Tax=Dyadobacter subterraneus TaxID=2773304 RepID=A0ABR9WJX5_9BACT|nr:hypothetical protein [Dyadobacter subterraneus]MBE9465196.1 hypothetical protein [Dyadobacter subterraneus]
MKTLLFVLLLSAPASDLVSQTMPPGSGKENKEGIRVSPKGIYQFEEFKDGKVYFKNGKHTRVKLNYNYLHGEVEYIAASRDTLLITNKEFIDHISIGENIFYSRLKKGEMEVVGNFNNVLLAKKKYLAVKGSSANMSERKLTATSESAIPTSLLINNLNGEFQWQNNASRPDYKYKTTYYLIDQNRNFHPARRSGFSKIYAKQQDVLSEFLRKNEIDFDNEDQLKQLLKFCSEI